MCGSLSPQRPAIRTRTSVCFVSCSSSVRLVAKRRRAAASARRRPAARVPEVRFERFSAGCDPIVIPNSFARSRCSPQPFPWAKSSTSRSEGPFEHTLPLPARLPGQTRLHCNRHTVRRTGSSGPSGPQLRPAKARCSHSLARSFASCSPNLIC